MTSFLILIMFRTVRGNIYAWRFLRPLLGGVGWGLGTMFARQGDMVKIRELKFGREFETEFSICRTWCFFKILEKQLVKIFKLNLAQDFEAEVLSRFWGWSLIKIPKLKFGIYGIYSEAKFWCYLKAVTLVKGLYPRVRCALALF